MVLKKKIFKVFTIYRHGGHLCLVTWTIYINIYLPEGLIGIGPIVPENNFENVDLKPWTENRGFHPIISPGALGSGEQKHRYISKGNHPCLKYLPISRSNKGYYKRKFPVRPVYVALSEEIQATGEIFSRCSFLS